MGNYTHYQECEDQAEGKSCICAQLKEEYYYRAVDNQIDDIILNLI